MKQNNYVGDSNQEIDVYEEIDVFPLEGAYAFIKALNKMDGHLTLKDIEKETMFGRRKYKPIFTDIEIGFDKRDRVIWGGFEVPGITGCLETSSSTKEDGTMNFCIKGSILRKDENNFKEIIDLTRSIAKKESIYKNQAIKLSTNPDGYLYPERSPKFLDLTNTNSNNLILNSHVKEQVNINLFTPVRNIEKLIKNKISIKRGVLLTGQYGTGKTLVAFSLAKEAVNNGWTFIFVDKVSGYADAFKFASRYTPAIIFCEDVDRAFEGSHRRTVDIDEILNNIDGIESKSQQIISVFTTNNIDGIQRAMLRPGRLDAIIDIPAANRPQVIELLRLYGGGCINENENLDELAAILDGCIPAIIREVVDRAKLKAIMDNHDNDVIIKANDLILQFISMKNHIDQLQKVEP